MVELQLGLCIRLVVTLEAFAVINGLKCPGECYNIA